jgi:hypothetical protein
MADSSFVARSCHAGPSASLDDLTPPEHPKQLMRGGAADAMLRNRLRVTGIGSDYADEHRGGEERIQKTLAQC